MDSYLPSEGFLATGVINLVGWHHLATVRAAANPKRRVYLDNVLIASQNNSETYASATTNRLCIGGIYGGGSIAFPCTYGSFFDVRGFNRALAAGEVSDIYGGRGRDSILDSGMLFRVLCCDGYSGSTLDAVYDHSIYKRSFLIAGTPTVAADPFPTVKGPRLAA